MFYRYEAKRYGSDEWEGICQAMTPDHRRKIARFMKDPKWYSKNPDADSTCWFTKEGYDKYHRRIEEIIEDCEMYYYPLKVRLLMAKELPNIVMSGKIQAICLNNPDLEVFYEQTILS